MPTLLFSILLLSFPLSVVAEPKQPLIINSYLSMYSREDSCHYKSCLNASGQQPKFGDIACPRWIPLLTEIKILGEIYTCTDRYAKWVDEKRGLPTFDIFTEKGSKEARRFGLWKDKVEVYL